MTAAEGAPDRAGPDLLSEFADEPRSGDDAGSRSGLDAARERHGTVEVTCRYRCATGTVFGGDWRGVPVAPLLDRAPPETTHLRVESADGYRAHVPVTDALDAVVATERLDGAAEGLPRFVAPDLDSTRTVRGVSSLVPVALPPDADPTPGTDGTDGAESDESTDTPPSEANDT